MTPNERDFDAKPYTPDEARVAKYLSDLTSIGAGEDPIGFLIASHRTLARMVARMTKDLNTKV